METRATHEAAGVARRARVPVESLGAWTPPADRRGFRRPDPGQARSRLPALVPIRMARMAVSPFTFMRGGALGPGPVTAPRTGSWPAVRRRASVELRALRAPERNLVFDVNDFDETLPGPFEWDVKRLAASLVVAGRDARLRRARRAGTRCVAAARRRTASAWPSYAAMRAARRLLRRASTSASVLGVAREAARKRASSRRIASGRATATRVARAAEARRRSSTAGAGSSTIRRSSSTIDDEDRRRSGSSRFARRRTATASRRTGASCSTATTLVDVARRWSASAASASRRSSGSCRAGTVSRCSCRRSRPRHPCSSGSSAPTPTPSHGARVVAGQRRLQAASDVLLGRVLGDRCPALYLRQLQDQKGAAVVEAMDAEDLASWAGAPRLGAGARPCSCTGEPATLAGYLGTDKAFEHALGGVRHGLRGPERPRPCRVRRGDPRRPGRGGGGLRDRAPGIDDRPPRVRRPVSCARGREAGVLLAEGQRAVVHEGHREDVVRDRVGPRRCRGRS